MAILSTHATPISKLRSIASCVNTLAPSENAVWVSLQSDGSNARWFLNYTPGKLQPDRIEGGCEKITTSSWQTQTFTQRPAQTTTVDEVCADFPTRTARLESIVHCGVERSMAEWQACGGVGCLEQGMCMRLVKTHHTDSEYSDLCVATAVSSVT